MLTITLLLAVLAVDPAALTTAKRNHDLQIGLSRIKAADAEEAVNEEYRDKLRLLIKQFTKDGNFEAAVASKSELDRMTNVSTPNLDGKWEVQFAPGPSKRTYTIVGTSIRTFDPTYEATGTIKMIRGMITVDFKDKKLEIWEVNPNNKVVVKICWADKLNDPMVVGLGLKLP